MPAPKKLLVLDLGMQSLRLAEFAADAHGSLKLLRGARREFLIDPSLEASRPEQIRIAVQEILSEWKLSKGDVSCVLPSHTVFSRVVPLDVPGGGDDQVAALVNFEAQQNIPFPLEEVVWDYKRIGQTPSGSINVLFVAVKTDVLESLCNAVNSTGLRISSVTVAPVALHDAFRHACPGELESTILLLDVGSRTTNMVIPSPGSFFSRSIPSGGLAVTTALAKDINSTLEVAELLKVTRGSVALGAGFEPPSDPVEANIARITRQTLLKTQADISRSLSYYRSNLGGESPDRILLTGGMAGMPYLAEFLNEKLLKQTSFFDPMQGVGQSAAAASFIETNLHNLGELVGGALSLVGAPRTAINLLPPSLARQRELTKRLPLLTAAAVLLLGALASWYAFALNATSVTRDATARLSTAIAEESRISTQIQNLSVQLAAVGKTSDTLLSLIRLREAYPALLSDLSARVPERFLWITSFQPGGDPPKQGESPKAIDETVKTVTIKGLYLDNPRQAGVIDDFVNAIQASEIFAVDEKEKTKIITQRGSPNAEYWAYPFSLTVPLRNPVTPLP
jgi:type IV pilus assembly protein PilM